MTKVLAQQTVRKNGRFAARLRRPGCHFQQTSSPATGWFPQSLNCVQTIQKTSKVYIFHKYTVPHASASAAHLAPQLFPPGQEFLLGFFKRRGQNFRRGLPYRANFNCALLWMTGDDV
jgi:hypothetical protein